MTLLRPRNALVAALAMLPLAACSSSAPPPPPMAMAVATPPALPQPDAMFMNSAATANANEIAAAQLAQKNGGPAVRRFATRMITDHEMAGQKMMALAQTKMVTPPMAPDDAHQGMVASMANVKGRVFDKGYMDGQVTDHAAAVALFEGEARDGSDPDVKAFATQNLPTMRQHLAMARRLDPKR